MLQKVNSSITVHSAQAAIGGVPAGWYIIYDSRLLLYISNSLFPPFQKGSAHDTASQMLMGQTAAGIPTM